MLFPLIINNFMLLKKIFLRHLCTKKLSTKHGTNDIILRNKLSKIYVWICGLLFNSLTENIYVKWR